MLLNKTIFHTDPLGPIDMSCNKTSLIAAADKQGFRVEETARTLQIYDNDTKLGYFLFDANAPEEMIAIDFCESTLLSIETAEVHLPLEEYRNKMKRNTHSYIVCSTFGKNMDISGDRCIGCSSSSGYSYCRYADDRCHVITDTNLGLTVTIQDLAENSPMIVVEKTDKLPIDYS